MKQIFIFALLVCFALPLTAQDVREVKKGMSMGVKESFAVDITNLDKKEIEKLLMDYLKEYKGKRNPKKDRKSDEILVDDAEIPALSGNTIDLYASMDAKGDEATVNFWFDLGGAFLSQESHPEKMEALSEWLYGFGKLTRARVVEIELEEHEDKLKDLNKEYERLTKDQEKLEDTIRKAEEAIAKAKKDLVDNAQEQENKQEEIVEQQKVVEKVKDKLKKVN